MAEAELTLEGVAQPAAGERRVGRIWSLLRRDKVAVIALTILVLFAVAAFVWAPLLGPEAVSQALVRRMRAPFQGQYGLRDFLGTDPLGRSVLYRMVAGATVSLSIALSSALTAALIGCTLGIYAGFRRGRFDVVIMRIADVIMGFPLLLLAILFLYILEPRATNIVILLAIGRLPLYVRTARAEALEVSRRLFVDAARCVGASQWRLCFQEIAPVVAPTMLTLLALDVGQLMLIESALTFLGVGIQPPSVSWGLMVSEGRQWIRNAWWLTFFPGLAIFLCAVSSNVLANWLRLALDPAQRWRLELPQQPRRPGRSLHSTSRPPPQEADAVQTPTDHAVLAVDNLRVTFATSAGTVQAVRGIDLSINRGETLVVIGESGSGKSVTARAILGILPSPPARIEAGRVLYGGRDLIGMRLKERRSIQGDRIAMVFQDALASLNPVFTVGWQIAEVFHAHRGLPWRDGYRRAEALLAQVGIPNARERLDDYAHQFSGGQRQRIMIALALALEPDVLIADEPTTALDVTVQAQILQLLAQQRRVTGMALLLITHDIAVASEIADRVVVMYAGRIVETASAEALLNRQAHPYSRALVALASQEGARRPIGGAPPDMTNPPAGCAFAPRCPFAEAICTAEDPALRAIEPARASACHSAEEVIRGL